MNYDLAVTGGGPAGIMAACTAASMGLKTVLLEKNKIPGKKLSITGNGRCNLTNLDDINSFQDKIVNNGKFLYSALKIFDNHSLIELFNSLGVKTKTEEGNRVFPVSDNSSDIIKALQDLLYKNKVKVLTGSNVQKIFTENNQVSGILLNNNNFINCHGIILATGGLSYPKTGSTGDGHKIACNLGHTVITPRPGLVPLETIQKWPRKLQGLSLQNVKIKAIINNKIIEKHGEIIFTHYGLSGPAVLNISSYINNLSMPVTLRIDLMPRFSREQLEKYIQRELKKHSGKILKNSLVNILAARFVPVFLNYTGINADKKADHINKEEKKQIAYSLKDFTLDVKNTRPVNEAIITAGGIDTKEINPSTMESKLIKNLFFAGEIIDVDALTGGYNLQIAFSTGYLSGLNAGKQLSTR